MWDGIFSLRSCLAGEEGRQEALLAAWTPRAEGQQPHPGQVRVQDASGSLPAASRARAEGKAGRLAVSHLSQPALARSRKTDRRKPASLGVGRVRVHGVCPRTC